MLGGADGIGAGRVHDRDTPFGGRRHVDGVHPDAGPGHHLEIRRAGDHVRSHLRLAADDEGRRRRECGIQLLARLAGEVDHVNLRGGREQGDPGVSQLVGDDDANAHARVRSMRARRFSRDATVWSPMWPIRKVESFTPPYPVPMTHPSFFTAATRSLETLPAGILMHETVQLRRPSGGRYESPTFRTHCSVAFRMSSCRFHRASMPPAASMRASWTSSAKKSDSAGVLVGWYFALAFSNVIRSK